MLKLSLTVLLCAMPLFAAQDFEHYQTKQLEKDRQFIRFIKRHVLQMQKSRSIPFINNTCALLDGAIELYQKEYPFDVETDIYDLNSHVYQEGVWNCLMPFPEHVHQEKRWKTHRILAYGILEDLCKYEAKLQKQINPNWTKKHSRLRKRVREQFGYEPQSKE